MNNILEIMKSRHSVRQYIDKPIPAEIRNKLDEYTNYLNKEGNLNIQIIYDEPKCFSSRMASYGKFEGCSNYIALIGKKAKDLDERCGYYGEALVLKAQELGLNTCWVALTHGKSMAKVAKDEEEVILISLGYGKHQGFARRSKDIKDVSNVSVDSPSWFKEGVEAALLAPTAINQQKFYFELLDNNVVKAKKGLIGPELNVDLGIVKYHFEVIAKKENFSWAK